MYPYAYFSMESILLRVLNGKERLICLCIFCFTQVRYFEMLIGSAIYSTAFAVLRTDLKQAVQNYFFTVNCKHNCFVLWRKTLQWQQLPYLGITLCLNPFDGNGF